jgi:hypothetical protein
MVALCQRVGMVFRVGTRTIAYHILLARSYVYASLILAGGLFPISSFVGWGDG